MGKESREEKRARRLREMQEARDSLAREAFDTDSIAPPTEESESEVSETEVTEVTETEVSEVTETAVSGVETKPAESPVTEEIQSDSGHAVVTEEHTEEHPEEPVVQETATTTGVLDLKANRREKGIQLSEKRRTPKQTDSTLEKKSGKNKGNKAPKSANQKAPAKSKPKKKEKSIKSPVGNDGSRLSVGFSVGLLFGILVFSGVGYFLSDIVRTLLPLGV